MNLPVCQKLTVRRQSFWLQKLVEIDAVVPWEEFRPLLDRVWRKPESERKSRAGRKPMDAVLMLKTLVLGALYNLSAVFVK